MQIDIVVPSVRHQVLTACFQSGIDDLQPLASAPFYDHAARPFRLTKDRNNRSADMTGSEVVLARIGDRYDGASQLHTSHHGVGSWTVERKIVGGCDLEPEALVD